MSVLLGHIKAFRALAEAFAFEGNEARCGPESAILIRTSAAYSRAADSLEAQARAEASGPPQEHFTSGPAGRSKSEGRP